ncbi:MAG: hypothetical protein ACK5RG_15110 [Cyclobacteriaceae bacterium]
MCEAVELEGRTETIGALTVWRNIPNAINTPNMSTQHRVSDLHVFINQFII